MKTIVAIRTHRWDEDAQRLYEQLLPVFGDALVVAFHDRPKGLALPLPVVDLNDRWLRTHQLQRVPDWGWRCGDYFLYAVRAAHPAADFIWLIEPDVFFTGDVADFFHRMGQQNEDLLGVQITDMPAGHRFSKGLKGLALRKALFALTRFSGRAADRLFRLRQDYGTQGVGARFYTNDELFCFSHGLADPDLTSASMADLAPDWLSDRQMSGDPDIFVDVLKDLQTRGIFHPVRSRDSFRKAVAQRVTAQMGYLGAMANSLALLSDEDRLLIATDVGERCLRAMNVAAGQAGGAK